MIGFWVRKALGKAGIHSLKSFIFISEGDFTLRYLNQEFHQIADLIDFIRMAESS